MPTLATPLNVGDGLLKNVYENQFQRVFNSQKRAQKMFRRKTVAPGLGISHTVWSAMGGGASSGSDTAPAATPENKRATFMPIMANYTIAVLEELLERAASAAAADENPMDEVMENGALAFADIWDQMILGGAGDGKCADLHATPAATATTLVVDNCYGLFSGMRVDVLLKLGSDGLGNPHTYGSTGAGGVRDARIHVDELTNVVTLLDGKQFEDGSGAAINAAPSTYALYHNRFYNNAPWGLLAAISASNPPVGTGPNHNGFFGELDRTVTTNSFWKARRHHNTSSPGTKRRFTFKMHQDVMDDLSLFTASEDSPTLALIPYQIWSGVLEDETIKQRRNGDIKRFKGWAESFQIGNCQFVRAKHAPQDRILYLDQSTFDVIQTHNGKFMDKDGAILARIAGKVGYGAVWHWTSTLRCIKPNCNAVLEDIEYVA